MAACVVASLVVLVPGIHGHAVQPAFDLVMDTTAAVVCMTLTA
jgi:hypothetical protein